MSNDKKKYAPVLTAEELTKKMMEGMRKDAEEAAKAPKRFDVAGGQYVVDTPEMYEDK